MKIKLVAIISLLFSIVSCSVNYTKSKFYVTNTSEHSISFTASVLKYTSLGPEILTVPFIVAPNDTVLARSVSLHKNAEPQHWFREFIIFPIDGVQINDPKQPDNWVKSLDNKGRAVYIFNLSE